MPLHHHDSSETLCEWWFVDEALRIHYTPTLLARSGPADGSGAKRSNPIVTTDGPLAYDAAGRPHRLLRPHPDLTTALWHMGRAVDSADPLANASELVLAWERRAALINDTDASDGSGSSSKRRGRAHAGSGDSKGRGTGRPKVTTPRGSGTSGATEPSPHVHFGVVRIREHERDVEIAEGGSGEPDPLLHLGWGVAAEHEEALEAQEAQRARDRVGKDELRALTPEERRAIADSATDMLKETLGTAHPGERSAHIGDATHRAAALAHAHTHGHHHGHHHEHHGLVADRADDTSGMTASEKAEAAVAYAMAGGEPTEKDSSFQTREQALAAGARELNSWSLSENGCLRVAGGHTSRVKRAHGRVVLTDTGSTYYLGDVDARVAAILAVLGARFDPDEPFREEKALKHADRCLMHRADVDEALAAIRRVHSALAHGPAKAWVNRAFWEVSQVMSAQIGKLGFLEVDWKVGTPDGADVAAAAGGSGSGSSSSGSSGRKSYNGAAPPPLPPASRSR